jgi:Kef-type K+ transport system membrane component KefB
MDESASESRQESHKERIDRELLELLNELRVALPGVQVLFAFLLTVPFAQRWTSVTTFQRDTYFVTLLCTALSSALLIAPTAQHRLLFRQKEKEKLLITANWLSIIGLFFLAVAIIGVVLLITDVLFGATMTIVVTIATAIPFLLAWYAYPLARRMALSSPERASDESE